MKAGLRASVFSLRSSRRGFTLIELLVVIAIIGVLALITIPVLGRVQERGREAQCVSNLRQLHMAAFNRGRFPNPASATRYELGDEIEDGEVVTAAWVASIDEHAWWYEQGGSNGTLSVRKGQLFPYLGDAGDESVYICPTAARYARNNFKGEKRHVTRSYGMNPRMGGRTIVGTDGFSRTFLFADQGLINMGGRRTYLSAADDGFETGEIPAEGDVYWEDNEYYWMRVNTIVDGVIDYNLPEGRGKEWIGGYHGSQANVKGAGRGNAVFVDGHVESVMYEHTDFIGRGDWERGKPIP